MARQQRTDTVEVAHSPRRIPFSVPSHTGQTSCPTESIAGHAAGRRDNGESALVARPNRLGSADSLMRALE